MSTGHLVNIMEQILSPMPLVISALLLNLINLRDAAAQQFFHDSTYLEVAVARTPFEIQSSSGVNYASPLESLPFELYGNLILIRVRVNHSEPLRFILDSGAERIFARSGCARCLKIPPHLKQDYAWAM